MKTTLVIVALLAGLGLVSAMDYRDEQRSQEHYCEMVNAGHWPDYKELGDTCTK